MCIFYGYIFLKHLPEISVPIICSLDCERKVMLLVNLFYITVYCFYDLEFFWGERVCLCLADSAEASFSFLDNPIYTAVLLFLDFLNK